MCSPVKKSPSCDYWELPINTALEHFQVSLGWLYPLEWPGAALAVRGMMPKSTTPAVSSGPGAVVEVKVLFYYLCLVTVGGFTPGLQSSYQEPLVLHLCSTCVPAPCKWLSIHIALGLACAIDNVWWCWAGCWEESPAEGRFAARILPARREISSEKEQTGCKHCGWRGSGALVEVR